MIVLKIIGIAIACLIGTILLLLILVSLVKVGIRLSVKSGEPVLVRYRVCGILFGGKKKSEKPKKEKKAGKKSKKTFSEILDLLKSGLQLLRLVKERLPWLIGKARLKKLDLICVAADSDAADAALLYGGACAVIYPALDLLQDIMRVDNKAIEAEIRCDFDAEKPNITLEAEVSLRVFHALRFVWHVLVKKVLLDLEDAKDESTTKQQ